MSRRWPLHPPPYPGEALSSWVKRIARALDVPPAVLLYESGTPRTESTQFHLDFNPPEYLLDFLAERTGQANSDVRRLTARGYVPSLLDTLDKVPHGMAAYTRGLTVLLPMRHRPDRHEFVVPWHRYRRFRQPRGCPDCLEQAVEPYLRLHWRFSWMLSCPLHRRMLEPLRIEVPAAALTQVTWPWLEADAYKDITPQQLLAVDAITLQAIAGDACRLPWGNVPAAFWMRLLRTVLDELGVGTVHAGDHHQPIREVWDRAGLGYSHYLREWRPYESLKQKYQEMFMLMASQVFADAFEQPVMLDRIREMARTYRAGPVMESGRVPPDVTAFPLVGADTGTAFHG